MSAACCAVLVSGFVRFGLDVEILSDVGHCLLHFLERLLCFCSVSVFDAANVGTDSTEEILLIQHHQMDFLGAKFSGDAGLRNGDLGAILEEITRGLLSLHCVVRVLCVERELLLPSLDSYPTASSPVVNPPEQTFLISMTYQFLMYVKTSSVKSENDSQQ